MRLAVNDKEMELAHVIEWRIAWLRSGGYNKRNATIIANRPAIDWRYANEVLTNCKYKGYDEDFVNEFDSVIDPERKAVHLRSIGVYCSLAEATSYP